MRTGDHIEPGCASSASAVDSLDLPSSGNTNLSFTAEGCDCRFEGIRLRIPHSKHLCRWGDKASIDAVRIGGGQFHHDLIILWRRLNAMTLQPEQGRYLVAP